MAARVDQRAAKAAGAAALFLAAFVVAAPVLAVLASLVAPHGETIRHVAATVGFSYIAGTLLLCLGVGALAGAIGVAGALLTTVCEFPFRRMLSFALVLPLAAPSYIVAYAYGDLLGPFGALAPLAEVLAPIGLPPIKSLAGAVFVLALSLYPYAYLTTRAAVAARSAATLETARMLGAPPFAACIRLLVPLSRPALAGGVALIMMETAAEFGVADYFGVATLSVGIFRTWHSFGDLAAASQLAAALFLFAAVLVAFEMLSRQGRISDDARRQTAAPRIRLRGAAACAASLACAAPAALGFVIPAMTIAAKALSPNDPPAIGGLADAISNSAMIASLGAAVTLATALAFSYAGRGRPGVVGKGVVRVATLGYAAPGAVIAIGILTVFSAVASLTGIGALAASGPLALTYAYCVRFLTAGYNATSAGLAQVSTAIDSAARNLGASPMRLVAAIHAPLLRRSILAAATIVFVDIIKELPATLILRDFNFETLATRVYRLAGDERLAEAAPAALLLIALSAAPMLFFNAVEERR